ncbi:hypothetical protein YY36_002756 [Salmonella enterica subsp. diarizonae]|nr:hypothetical protein [Salmonella enterica subsp. diarizonae]
MQEILSNACMYGNGVPQHTQMTLAWYRKAAERGWLKRKKLLLVYLSRANRAVATINANSRL